MKQSQLIRIKSTFNKNIQPFIYSLLFYCLAGFGISLTIRANIGVSSFNSMNVALSNVTQVKVGTITIGANLLFLVGYMFLTQFNKPLKYFIQGLSVFCFGMVINFFTYYFLPLLLPTHYLLKIITFIAGTILAGISTGFVVYFEIITFPIEGFCLSLSQRTRISFGTFRYLIDIFCVVVSIILSLMFDLPFYAREGTLISLLLLSYFIHSTKIYCQKRFSR